MSVTFSTYIFSVHSSVTRAEGVTVDSAHWKQSDDSCLQMQNHLLEKKGVLFMSSLTNIGWDA